MDLKEFLQSKFNKTSFIQFISERFYGFEENLKGDFLGKVRLDDRKELGFFVFKVDDDRDISNSKVGFHKELKKYADENMLDGAIGAFYHPLQDAWRLSFIRFSYDDNHKKQVTSQKRFTFLLGNSKIKTAYEQLKNLKYPKMIDLEKSFAVEAVTKEFYKGLVSSFEKLLSEYLTYPSSDDNAKKEFAIRLIGRILFIKFLNKKNLVPDAIFELSNGYYHSKLEPLFFEQLNTPKCDRKLEFVNDSIPFLNGGLFEPLKSLDYYEWDNELRYRKIAGVINDLEIKDIFFTELYNHLNQYNFTIDENSIEDSELSIDPEMLGRIFENLLAEINPETSQNARKATGSYYTPREIVEYMVSSSLLEYLKTKTNIDETTLKTIVFQNQEPQADYDKAKILSAIFELKILDPACGSGAFPMGLLQKIVKILNLIDEDASIWFGLQSKGFKDAHKSRNKDYIRKLSIIKNTIYGVDIQPIAIEISKLRFFLSLIVDEDGEPEPLPNLEFKFVCANSLLPKPKKTQLASLEYFMLEGDLIKLKNEYFEASGERKKEIKKEYTQTQKKMFEEEEATNLLSALENKLTSYDPFDPISVAGFFDMDFMFNIKDGFDIVIGNPPYVSVKGLSPQIKKIFNNNYETGKGRLNLFTIFIEKGIKLLNYNGILAFIQPDGLFSNTEYRHIRKYIIKNSTVRKICLFSKRVFDASVDTAIIITKKEQKKLPYSFELDSDLVYSKSININFAESEDEYIFPVKSNNVIDKISLLDTINLNKVLEIQQGIIYSGVPKEEIFSNQIINEKYKKCLDGRDILKYQNRWNEKLENRYIEYDTSKLHRPREERLYLANKKILIPRRATKIYGTIDSEQFYVLNTAYIGLLKNNTFNIEFIMSILNSTLINYIYSTKYFGWQITIPALNSLPIKMTSKDNQKIFEILVDYVLFLKSLRSEQKIDEYVSNEHISKQFEEVIDGMVFELYFADEFKAKNIELIKYSKEDFRPIENLDDVSKQKVIKEVYLRLCETKNPIRNNLLLLPVEFDFIKTILWS